MASRAGSTAATTEIIPAGHAAFGPEDELGERRSTQRQVILLVGLEGMSYEESAGILGIPIGTARSRLARGRDDLRKLLGMEERRCLAALPQAA